MREKSWANSDKKVQKTQQVPDLWLKERGEFGEIKEKEMDIGKKQDGSWRWKQYINVLKGHILWKLIHLACRIANNMSLGECHTNASTAHTQKTIDKRLQKVAPLIFYGVDALYYVPNQKNE